MHIPHGRYFRNLREELGDGHYFINDPGLMINKPIKFVGDEHDPSQVVLELSGDINWNASGGWIEGITVRRSSITTQMTQNNEILRIGLGGRVSSKTWPTLLIQHEGCATVWT